MALRFQHMWSVVETLQVAYPQNLAWPLEVGFWNDIQWPVKQILKKWFQWSCQYVHVWIQCLLQTRYAFFKHDRNDQSLLRHIRSRFLNHIELPTHLSGVELWSIWPLFNLTMDWSELIAIQFPGSCKQLCCARSPRRKFSFILDAFKKPPHGLNERRCGNLWLIAALAYLWPQSWLDCNTWTTARFHLEQIAFGCAFLQRCLWVERFLIHVPELILSQVINFFWMFPSSWGANVNVEPLPQVHI